MATDVVLEAVVRSATACDAVGLCTQLLRQESTGLSAVTALLERVRMGMEEEAGVRTILQGIRGACAPPSAICDQLLQLLLLMSPPTALVEALPHFVGEDPADVSNVVKEYKELLEGDHSMLVHVIGSLHDLPLGADTRQEVSTMTLEALSVVDEQDVPVVVRTLFKAARERDSAMVVSRVRAECAGLGTTALAVLVDVLADSFSFNESVAKAFLAEITATVVSAGTAGRSSLADAGSVSTAVDGEDGEEGEEEEEEEEEENDRSLSTLDVVGFLLLLPNRRHVAAVHNLLEKLSRKPERFPTEAIVSLAEISGKPPWSCLANPIRELGLWAAIAFPAGTARSRASCVLQASTSAASAGNGAGSAGSGDIASPPRSSAASACLPLLRRAGSRILLAVFRGHPNARAPIVSCCLGVVGTHRLPTRGGVGVGVGVRPRAGERDSAADALLETCIGALDLLLELSENCTALMSPYANVVGDLVLGGGGRALHPRLLDKAARCLAALTRHSNGMVNELMNHVQKQVFFLGAGGGGGAGGGVGGLFRGGRSRNGLHAAGHGFPGVGGGAMGRPRGGPDAQRRSAIVLATHLIRGGALEERDEDALLGWAVRLLSLLRGVPASLETVALTLELLVTATLLSKAQAAGGAAAAGGGATGDSSRGTDGDQRRDGWRRGGASAAGRCLVGMGVLRLEAASREEEGSSGGGGLVLPRGRAVPLGQDEELVDVACPIRDERAGLLDQERGVQPRGAGEGGGRGGGGGESLGSSPSSPATLCARDVATAIWRDDSTSLSDSARSLHSSWFAAITLSCRSGEPAFHGSASPAASSHRLAGGAATAVASTAGGAGQHGSGGAAHIEAVGGDSWLRARLSMPVWPFSDDYDYCSGEAPTEDSGGYWGVDAGTSAGAAGYSLWRIPAAESAWQGSEGTQQLVEAGAACVAARSLLSAAARYLLAQLPAQSSPPKSTNGATTTTASNTTSSSRNARSSCIENQEDGGARDAEGGVNGRRPVVAVAAAAAGAGGRAALMSDIVWRYLELGARGRVCVAALRRSAREMAGNGGGSGKGGSSEGVGSSAGLGEEEGAAARLEEGLEAELMPLECLCRLVSPGVESRVAFPTRAAMETTTASSHPAESRSTGDSTSSTCSSTENKSAEVPLGSVMESVSTPSILQMAYVELLRTLVSRLETGVAGAVRAPAAPEGGGRGGEDGRVGGVWAGVRALDLETLFRGTVSCSKALPVARRAQASKAASRTRLKTTPQKRRASPTAQRKNSRASARRGDHRLAGTGGTAAAAKRQKHPAAAAAAVATEVTAGGGSGDTARWLGGDSVRRREGGRRRPLGGGIRGVMEGNMGGSEEEQEEDGEEEEEEEEEEEMVFSEESCEGSGWDSSETGDSDDDNDDDSFSDDSEREETKNPTKRQASTPRGKKRAAAGPWSETPASARRNGGSGRNGRGDDDGDGESNPWEGMAGLSLCQFWRYRFLLEVVLAARGGGVQAGGREEHGRVPEPRLAELLRRLAAATPGGSAAAFGCNGGANGSNRTPCSDDEAAVFSELSVQLDKAEDGLLAGMITEVLAALSSGLPRAEEAAALSWKELGAVYPRGYGTGYCHLGGVLLGLRRGGTSLLSSPLPLRFFLDRCGGAASRLRGQLAFSPNLGNPAMLPKTGLPSLPFLQHALLTHWSLCGRAGRAWALAATVADIEAFVLGKPGPTGGVSEPATSKNSFRHKPPPSCSSSSSSCYFPARTLLSQENLDVFVAAAVKLLPASLTLAAPRTADTAATTTAALRGCPPGDGVADGGYSGAGSRSTKRSGRSGRRSAASAGLGSPYEEVECLGMVLECLVEACTESLDSGAWTSSAGTEELTALGRLLRRCVLPVTTCCSRALRALESQLEKSLAWRCSQTLAHQPKGVRDRRRDAAASPGGSSEKADFGAAKLCTGLLEQCDLCADAVRALCTAVRGATFSEEKDGGEDATPSSASKPHRAALDRVVKILPGMVLQSDQLSTAVDNARRLLQLPRRPGGDTREGDKDELSPDHEQQHRRPPSTALKRASERLLSRFIAGGGGRGGQKSGAIVPRGGKGEKRSRLLSLGADLRGSRTKGDPLPSKKVFQRSTARVVPAAPAALPTSAARRGERPVERPSLGADNAPVASSENATSLVQGEMVAGSGNGNGAGPATTGAVGCGSNAAAAAAAAARGVALPNGGATGHVEVMENSGDDDEAEKGGMSGVGGYETFDGEEEEEEEEEEVDQFRAVGGWGTYS